MPRSHLEVMVPAIPARPGMTKVAALEEQGRDQAFSLVSIFIP
jgi:hypothetical protein